MNYLAIALIALTTLSSTVSAEPESDTSNVAPANRHQTIYQFEHVILPDWVHHSSGHFFNDLADGIPSSMTELAQQVVDQKFADALTLKAYPKKQAFALTFPTPEKTPECYFAIIKKEADGFSYFTLEQGLDLFGIGTSCVLCKWTEDGTHQNLGKREYRDLNSFAKEVLK
jgi:hypothetical protein